jgi:hypothetical protein
MLVQLDCTRVQKARTDAKVRVEVGNSYTYMELFDASAWPSPWSQICCDLSGTRDACHGVERSSPKH